MVSLPSGSVDAPPLFRREKQIILDDYLLGRKHFRRMETEMAQKINIRKPAGNIVKFPTGICNPYHAGTRLGHMVDLRTIDRD
jgi:hypothetical protein